MEWLTYAEVGKLFSSYASKGEQCIIAVVANKEGYERLPPNARDDFYVRYVAGILQCTGTLFGA